MSRSFHVPIASGRTFGAWVCLVAVVMLWAPLGAAAWQANGMACCEGGMCVAHGHSTTNRPKPQETSPGESPMNCVHHGDRGIVNCSMSCSHDGSSFLTTAVIFVLPGPAAISQPALVLAAPTTFVQAAFVRSYDPLSPPPRTSHFSL
jgi:hypothetical protein